MKKIWIVLSISLFSFLTYANDSIELSVNETLELDSSINLVSLDRLKINTVYKITCRIQNNDVLNAAILLEPHLLASARYGDVTLNNESIANTNKGMLLPENNTLFFRVLIEKEDIDKYNYFVISNPLNTLYKVQQCIADEELSPFTRTSHVTDGGFFYAINDTDKIVTISVGNIWPTEYLLRPHDWRFVWVTTDNQDIHILNIQ